MNSRLESAPDAANQPSDGPRASSPGTLRAAFLIAAHTMQKLLRPKRLIFLAIVCFIPAGIALIAKHEGADNDFFAPFAPVAYLLILAPLTSLFLAATNFADEVDNRTLSYLLLRPIPRETILFGQCLGAAFVSSLLFFASSAAAHLIFAWPGAWGPLFEHSAMEAFPGFFGVGVLAIALYTGVSALAGLVLKRPVLWGLFYMVIVEIGFCYAAGPPSKVAISHHTTQLLPQYYLSPEEVVSIASGRPLEAITDTETAIGLGVFGCLVVALALLSVRRSEFSAKED